MEFSINLQWCNIRDSLAFQAHGSLYAPRNEKCVFLDLHTCVSEQIAWALNKGVKQEYKQFWDVDLGVTYIPWEKVKLDDLDGFAEGGIIDQETVNDGEKKYF